MKERQHFGEWCQRRKYTLKNDNIIRILSIALLNFFEFSIQMRICVVGLYKNEFYKIQINIRLLFESI